ncbi:MAG: hypothetical protein AAF517_04475, partial [Planctomycetota bacterium]
RLSRSLKSDVVVVRFPSDDAVPLFRRGDCNADATFDISDPIRTLGRLFLGGDAFACRDACDTNDDGAVDISDAVTALRVLFAGATPIPAPGSSECGRDPSDDREGCDAYDVCP